MDAMTGDATLYTRQDMVEASWQVVTPILEDWAEPQVRFSELRSGHLGSGGGRRDAGAAGASVEE